MNLTFKLLYLRKILAKVIPRFARKYIPKRLSRHLYFSGPIDVMNEGKLLCRLINHSEFENSIYWAGNEISGSTEGLTLSLFTKVIEKLEISSFLDGGANSGNFGFICLGAGANLREITFIEPLPHALEILYKNLYLNSSLVSSDRRVLILETALTDFDGDSELYFDSKKNMQLSASLSRNFDRRNDSSIQVKCSTLATCVKEHSLLPPDLVKLDIEGGEINALRGFGKHLSAVKCFFLEVLDSVNAIELSKLFSPSNYVFIDIDDRGCALKVLDSVKPSSYRNILICRSDYRSVVQEILEELR